MTLGNPEEIDCTLQSHRRDSVKEKGTICEEGLQNGGITLSFRG